MTVHRDNGTGQAPQSAQLAVGRVSGPHGLRGEVLVDVRTDDPEIRFASGAVLGTRPPQAGPLTVRGSRWHGSRLLVRFEQSRDRSTAETLRGTELTVSAAELPPSQERDEFHDHELIDLPVTTLGGQAVGTVVDVLHPPGQDVLVVRLPAGGEVLIPFVSAIVPEVDLVSGRLAVDPPPGLIDTGETE